MYLRIGIYFSLRLYSGLVTELLRFTYFFTYNCGLILLNFKYSHIKIAILIPVPKAQIKISLNL